ncbi:leucyl aminopeptidase [Massilia sp. W12]|uniref:leucyl aminopeptidase n=1 Tax=Massilia sp. W12 TaxID=3126507 RepID=UPI0030D6045D
MDFSIKTLDPKAASAKTACIICGVFENRKLPAFTAALDAGGHIAAALKAGDISGKAGSTLLLRKLDGVAAERVLLVGLGADEEVAERDFLNANESAYKALANLGAADAINALTLVDVKKRDLGWRIESATLAAFNAEYKPDFLKSKREDAYPLKKLALGVASAKEATLAKQHLAAAIATGNGVNLARELADLPGNVVTPTYLGNTAKKLAKDFKFDVEVLERKQIEALKMGSFLSVANGSDEPPRFIVMKYNGGKAKEAPVVLVGKGITFDTGGISIKPAANMDEMKYDMGGAASVFGTMRTIVEMGLKLNVVGIVAACENMPSGRATKPGDIFTSMSGQTVEVLNTDAEGRLILCDALTYAERFNPAAVIDIATLTGACVVALGHHTSGLFTRHDEAHDALADEILAAGRQSGDVAWRMPVFDIYQDQLKSNFADIPNMGTPGAGSIIAACFLERFTRKYTWAHLDIAGTAWRSSPKGATGRPVGLLTQFLRQRTAK